MGEVIEGRVQRMDSSSRQQRARRMKPAECPPVPNCAVLAGEPPIAGLISTEWEKAGCVSQWKARRNQIWLRMFAAKEQVNNNHTQAQAACRAGGSCLSL